MMYTNKLFFTRADVQQQAGLLLDYIQVQQIQDTVDIHLSLPFSPFHLFERAWFQLFETGRCDEVDSASEW